MSGDREHVIPLHVFLRLLRPSGPRPLGVGPECVACREQSQSRNLARTEGARHAPRDPRDALRQLQRPPWATSKAARDGLSAASHSGLRPRASGCAGVVGCGQLIEERNWREEGRLMSFGTVPPTQRRGWLKNGNPVGDFSQARRCGAKTRQGTPCRCPAMRNGRCRLHGGLSTGPKTPEGVERIRRAVTKHGRYRKRP